MLRNFVAIIDLVNRDSQNLVIKDLKKKITQCVKKKKKKNVLKMIICDSSVLK